MNKNVINRERDIELSNVQQGTFFHLDGVDYLRTNAEYSNNGGVETSIGCVIISNKMEEGGVYKQLPSSTKVRVYQHNTIDLWWSPNRYGFYEDEEDNWRDCCEEV